MRRGKWSRSFDGRRPVFIGDELTAAGFRLAGVHVHTPARADTLASFRRALKESDLVLISVEYARSLPAQELQEAVRGLSPLVLIMPDIQELTPLRDIEERLARELGVQL